MMIKLETAWREREKGTENKATAITIGRENKTAISLHKMCARSSWMGMRCSMNFNRMVWQKIDFFCSASENNGDLALQTHTTYSLSRSRSHSLFEFVLIRTNLFIFYAFLSAWFVYGFFLSCFIQFFVFSLSRPTAPSQPHFWFHGGYFSVLFSR